jgi:hypothetical protein
LFHTHMQYLKMESASERLALGFATPRSGAKQSIVMLKKCGRKRIFQAAPQINL